MLPKPMFGTLRKWHTRSHFHSFILETYIASLQETTTHRHSQPSHGQKRRTSESRACFKKNSSLHIWPKNFSTTFFRILSKNVTFLSLKNSDDLFLVIALFYNLLPFHIWHIAPLSSSLTPRFSLKTLTFFRILP